MRSRFPVLFLFLTGSVAQALDHLLIIGDSLSKEYEFEGSFIGVDPFPPPSPYPKSWSELLEDRRESYFDFGNSDFHADIRALGHDYNWSVPGSFASDWRDTYLANPPDELEEQLSQARVKRIVVWLGGNDVRSQYGPLYEGQLDPAAWATQTYDDLAFVLDWIIARRQADVHVVLVNVAHLGATISKNRDHPYDAVKTGRVTAALDDLNARLATLAKARGVGFADIYGLTKEWILKDQFSIGGWLIQKRASGDADTNAMFLGDGFHPNMPVQAIFAQIILDTFNARYGTSIPRLTYREIVEHCLQEDPDFTFSEWVTSYGIAPAEQSIMADPDTDGTPNIVEFGLDLDPTHADANLLPQPRTSSQSGQQFLTLTWQPRDPTNAEFCEITPQQSGDLMAWTNVPAASVLSGSPNTKTVSLPVASNQRGWLRLQIRPTGL